MVNRDNSRRYWPVAVTVSVLLHGTILLALGLVPGRQVIEGQSAPKPQLISFTVAELDSGEVTFEEQSEPGGAKPSSFTQSKKPSASPQDDNEPVVAQLINTLGVGQSSDTATGNPGPEIIGQGPGGLPAGAATSFFQVPARGQRIVYIVDGSASMVMNGALRTACAELKESVRKLPAGARFQIIIYNDHAPVLLTRFQKWLEPTPDILREVNEALDRQIPLGSTEHELALRRAFFLEPDVVFFLTDADDLELRHVGLVNQLNIRRAAVHTIELNTRNRQRTDMPLQMIARQNRGEYRAVDLDQPVIPTYPNMNIKSASPK